MSKVAVLERFTLFGSGIAAILEKADCFDVIIQAEHMDGLLTMVKEATPEVDVIVVDVIHGENSGMKPIKKIRRECRNIPVLLIVSQNYADCFEEYIRLGVKGFIFNNSRGQDLVRAIKKLKEGKEYFGKPVWEIFKRSIQARKYKKKKDQVLTDREVAVLKLFSQGLSYKEIGVKLNISPRTVETHKRNILSKLKISSTADMVKYAYRNHIIA